MKPYTLTAGGLIVRADGSACNLPTVDDTDISVPHLAPHVISWTLPKGDTINVLVRYSCHCWTSKCETGHHHDDRRIMDGVRARVHDMARFEDSAGLPTMIASLHQHRIYVTASERNYGVYNMSFMPPGSLAYTAFFIIRQKHGKFNGVRHRLLLSVESAYRTIQPQKGTKTSLPAALSAGLRGKMVKYRR